MAYTFGANTGDDISFTGQLAAAANNGGTVVAGWGYPTTLTATRKSGGAGTVVGAEGDTTTSEIRMRPDNTTDGQWLTSGAGITIDKWWFIAGLAATENTTVAGAWRVWVGDAVTPPQEVTVTNPTARSGNYTGSSSWCLGNAGSAGTASWQGDIGWVVGATTNAVGIANPLGVITSGTLSNDDADRVYRRWVLPLWAGTPNADLIAAWSYAAAYALWHVPLDSPTAPVFQEISVTSTGTNMGRRAVTVSGATWTDHAPPRRLRADWPLSVGDLAAFRPL